MRALVTGITGQDGGYLTERLLAEGAVVHGLVHAADTQAASFAAAYPAVSLHVGDLGDTASLAAVLQAAQPDEVYNLAGISSVAYSWEHPVETAEVTGLGALRLLSLLPAGARFVQASSAEVFGQAPAPQSESTPLRPTSPYGVAKVFAHHAVQVARRGGAHASNAILFNHESPRRPPAFVTRKITQTVARIARGLEHELVLGNVSAQRDWGWAPDYVDAMMRAVRAPVPDDYVVATGEAHSVQDFALAAFARAGVAPSIRVDPSLARPGDPALLLGDASRAREVLGWKPTATFDELVGRMVDADLAALPIS